MVSEDLCVQGAEFLADVGEKSSKGYAPFALTPGCGVRNALAF